MSIIIFFDPLKLSYMSFSMLQIFDCTTTTSCLILFRLFVFVIWFYICTFFDLLQTSFSFSGYAAAFRISI